MDQADDLSFHSYSKMGSSSDGPNPLRPYYKPPSIGLPEPNPNQSGAPASPLLAPRRIGTNSSRDFRELFSDLDYGDYLPQGSPSVAEMAKSLVDRTIWNYSSTVLAQPFEVAKVILQCQNAGDITQSTGLQEDRGYFGREHEHIYSDSDSDSEAPSYFVPTTPEETPSRKFPRRQTASKTHSTTSSGTIPSSQAITLSLTRSDSILEVISQEWGKEGAFGVWKGTNSTFIYGILLKTIETWTRSFLSALLNIPDPTLGVVKSLSGPNILDSPSPITSISVVVISAGIAGFILSPIDIIRTRLIITPVSNGPRALLPSLRALPSLSCPPALLPITLLHSTIPSLISTSLPLCLRTWLNIDPILTPSAYSISSFFVSLVEIFIKLPLETVLRRGHVATLATSHHSTAQTSSGRKQAPPLLPLHATGMSPRLRTIVPVGPYKGIFGTLRYIIHEEGTRPISSVPSTPRIATATSSSAASQSQQQQRGRQQQLEPRRGAQKQERRGQGLKGTIRGWRFGFWALIGVYATAGLSASGLQEF